MGVWRAGSGKKALVGAVIGGACAFAPTGGAVVVPSDVAPSCWFQTNGPAAPLDSGDWYTNAATEPSEGEEGGERLHRFQITIPPGAAFPVTIRVRDGESRVGAADHDEVRGTRDPTRFRLFRPGGSLLAARTFAAGSANNSTFSVSVTAGDGPGTYVLTSETGALPISGDETATLNDDENGFRIEVSPDGLGTGGLGDDVDVAFTQATLACTDPKSSLSLKYQVPAGTSATTLRNFDLDSPGRVSGPLEYVAPDGSTVPGTMSANMVWNGGGTLFEGGDTVPIAAGGEGLWAIVVFGVTAANQVAFEAHADGARLPLSLTRRPNNVAPTAVLQAPSALEEGAGFTLALADAQDVDGSVLDLRFLFDCGDGVLRGPQVEPSRSCVAGNDGTATVRGRVVDGDGGESTYEAPVAVANVAPVFTPALNQTLPLRPRASVALGAFVDPGPDAPWLVTIDWGDGTARVREVAAAGALPRVAHRFERVGIYRVTVTVTDDGEASTDSFDVRIRRLCVVPKVKGKTLAGARKAIRARDCRVGSIKRQFSSRVRSGRVISQKPAAGKIRPRGTRVNLVVSKGRRG